MRTLYTTCPLCDGHKLKDVQSAYCHDHILYHPKLGEQINWKQCLICTHVFTEGYFEGEDEKLLFSNTQDIQKVGFQTEKQRNVSGRLIDKILPYIDKGVWLDVGFGDGSLLFTAQEYGFTPVGLDLRLDNVELMKLCGVEAYGVDIKDFSAKKANIISMCDVLEHIPYPKETLKAAHSLLEEAGVLFISCPNIDSMVWQLLPDSDNPYWGEIEHYHNFGRKRLTALLAECGFTVVRFGISERYRIGMEIIALKNNLK